MLSVSIQQLQQICNGNLFLKNQAELSKKTNGVSIDSRNITLNNIFIAIRGSNFDGHDYASQAVTNGALIVIVSKKLDIKSNQLVVTETKSVLAQLASFHAKNNLLNTTTIAITGSCGKTTVKHMLATVCGSHAKTICSEKSFNNEIGVPLTVLHAPADTKFLILEFGIRNFNDMDYLTNIVKPNIALITNITSCHLETLLTEDNIAIEKGKIYTALKQLGVAVINNDDIYASFWLKNIENLNLKKMLFGKNTDIYPSDISSTINDNSFVVNYKNEKFTTKIAMPGKHNVSNAIAVFAVAIAAGIPAKKIIESFNKFRSFDSRLEVLKLGTNILLNDCYNANLKSVTSAVELLSRHKNMYKIFIFGDIAELGTKQDEIHRQVGRLVKKAGISELICVGKSSEITAKEFGSGAKYFSDRNEFESHINARYFENCAILVKGSNMMQLDKIVTLIKKKYV